MTYEEIVKTLADADINPENTYGFEDCNEEQQKVFDTLGKTEVVYELGGGEGGGETVERVMHFKDHDVYISYGGYYYSNNGTTWDETLDQVFPKQKTVTVYE